MNQIGNLSEEMTDLGWRMAKAVPESQRSLLFMHLLPQVAPEYEGRPKELEELWQSVEREILPRVEKRDLVGFLTRALPASLSRRPSPPELKAMWATILELLPDVPVEFREGFLTHSLPVLLERSKEPEELEGECRMIMERVFPHIGVRESVPFTFSALPEALRHYEGKPLEEVLGVMTGYILPNMRERDKEDSMYVAMPESLRDRPSPEALKKRWDIILSRLLPDIPFKDRRDFFHHELPEMIKRDPSLQNSVR